MLTSQPSTGRAGDGRASVVRQPRRQPAGATSRRDGRDAPQPHRPPPGGAGVVGATGAARRAARRAAGGAATAAAT